MTKVVCTSYKSDDWRLVSDSDIERTGDDIRRLAKEYNLDEDKLREAIEEEELKWKKYQDDIERYIDDLIQKFEDDEAIIRQLKKYREEGVQVDLDDEGNDSN